MCDDASGDDEPITLSSAFPPFLVLLASQRADEEARAERDEIEASSGSGGASNDVTGSDLIGHVK